jgi:NitT/TauT family transport system substrate-binding protein
VANTTPAETNVYRVDAPRARVIVGGLRGLTNMPVFMGMEKGYFDDVGIDVELETGKSVADMVSALGTGQMDVNVGGISAGTFAAVSRDVDLRVVAAAAVHAPEGINHNWLLARKELYDAGELRDVRGLRGRRVALNAPGGIHEYLLAKLLQQQGLSLPDLADVTYLGYPDALLAVSRGAADAMLVAEPFGTEAVERGIATVIENRAYPGLQMTYVYFSPTFIRERPDVARRWLLAWTRGAREFESGGIYDEPNLSIAVRELGIDPVVMRKMALIHFSPNLEVDLPTLEEQMALWSQLGKLDLRAPVSPAQMVDPSFARWVIDRVGVWQPPATTATSRP